MVFDNKSGCSLGSLLQSRIVLLWCIHLCFDFKQIDRMLLGHGLITRNIFELYETRVLIFICNYIIIIQGISYLTRTQRLLHISFFVGKPGSRFFLPRSWR